MGFVRHFTDREGEVKPKCLTRLFKVIRLVIFGLFPIVTQRKERVHGDVVANFLNH